jgi:hypothetical protein
MVYTVKLSTRELSEEMSLACYDDAFDYASKQQFARG